MKVLFLDVDGVLNSAAFFERDPARSLFGLDPEALRRLQTVLVTTGAEIVLSSTWRLVPNAVDALIEAGLNIGPTTPRLATNHRGEEIRAWLDTVGNLVDKFAIVDDDADAGDDASLQPYFVQTSWQDGLQDSHVATLIQLLA